MTRLFLRLLRDVRLVPIVLIATIALFALKALGLVLEGGYLLQNVSVVSDTADDMEVTGTITPPTPATPPARQSPAAPKQLPKQSWAQQMFNFPNGEAPVESTPSLAMPEITGTVRSARGSDITGAVAAAPSAPKGETPAKGETPEKKKPQEPPPPSNGASVPLDVDHPVSAAERAVLESLQKRRTERDARAHELDVREDLLRAAEKRVGGRIDELKELEARVSAAVQQKDDAEVARFKNVVTMYENMKAKDAAKIFDGLDIKVLLDVAREINPRRMSDILAQMAPENAQRLTVELAVRSAQGEPSQAADLPKIQGKPIPN
jgi:flagellar motility protein MotE (MotC chaperone)